MWAQDAAAMYGYAGASAAATQLSPRPPSPCRWLPGWRSPVRSCTEELRRLPEELARVDALLDDSAFFCPFVPFFDPRMGRP
ncbi:hypothetical protein ACNJQJ_21835, partial [Mycobacterium tuberculosis]